jgi:predicted SprT family Zn-dependent metalloprotease
MPEPLAAWLKEQIVTSVLKFAQEDLRGKEFWAETQNERRAYPAAYVDGDGIHVDPLLVELLSPSESDYLAFIIEHELAHFRLGHVGKPVMKESRKSEELSASADAMNALRRAQAVPDSRIEELSDRWISDWRHPQASRLRNELLRRVKQVELAWPEVFRDYYYKRGVLWLNVSQGENCALNYLLSHAERIAPELELGGIEVYLKKGMRVDLLFLSKEKDYYVVEVKDVYSEKTLDNGAKQVKRYARALLARLVKQKIEHRAIIPVVATIAYPNKRGYLLKQEFSQKQISDFLKLGT